jgi:hypothetical protein
LEHPSNNALAFRWLQENFGSSGKIKGLPSQDTPAKERPVTPCPHPRFAAIEVAENQQQFLQFLREP